MRIFLKLTLSALPLLMAASAQAEVSWCQPGYVCLFGDMNYQGRFVGYYGNQSIPNVGNYMNDLTTSIWNRTNVNYCFYKDSNYGGTVTQVGPGGSVPALSGGFDPGLFGRDKINDTITSLRPC